MSVIGSNILAGASGQATGYNLTRSLRFRQSASANLTRTFSSAGNRKTWTYSAWVKLGSVTSAAMSIFAANSAASTISFDSYGSSYVLAIDGVYNGTRHLRYTSAIYRDPSAWYHIVAVVDTTQATDTNRLKLYVNGLQVSLPNASVGSYPSQNSDGNINNNIEHCIGERIFTDDYRFDGYMTEMNFIDGQALTPSSFGENNAQTGVWQPKRYSGTYGTNGFYLPFTDNSALTSGSNAGLGKDFSGNGNYWTTNNISITSGSTYDSMTDVPTLTSATASNFAVMNPLAVFPSTTAFTYSGGNLNVSSGNVSTFGKGISTMQTPSTGKFYWEVSVTAVTTVGDMFLGLMDSNGNAGIYRDAGNIWNLSGTGQTSGSTYTGGDIIGIAVDEDAGTVQFYKNNVAQGATPSFTFTAGTPLFAYIASDNNAGEISASFNFGQRPFAYTPPTGFVALNTFNLPTPTIGATASTQANKYFDIATYNNATVVSGLGFAPDFVWHKSRNQAYNHYLYDKVRGTGAKGLNSNTTSVEGANDALGIVSFDSTGVTYSSDAGLSQTNAVGWFWKANGSGSSNTAGSITSTVSANTSAGFSVVTYTGTGANATVGHGLGASPKMIIVKDRSATNPWAVYHVDLGVQKYIFLNATDAAYSNLANYWGSTAPSSTTFGIGAYGGINTNGDNYVAYCFSEVVGYSKFTSYTGNGSADGVFVYCGFRPKFLMIKRTDATDYWNIIDTARKTYNLQDDRLYANASFAEDINDGYGYDFLSNGFKARTSNAGFNASGGTYIVMAFAENPYKYSLAR